MIRAVQPDARASRPRRRVVWLAAVWIGLTLAAAWGLLQREIVDAAQRVEREALRLHATMVDRAILNEATVEGLAAALRICPRGDPNPAEKYANAMLARYPHIYLLAAATRIEHGLRESFQSALRAQGLEGEIRWFDYDHARRWYRVPDKPEYWPVQMAQPELEATWAILGMDLGHVPLFRDTLQRGLESVDPVSSGAFDLLTRGGARAFGLLRPVCDAVDGPCDRRDLQSTPGFVALLVVFADALVDCKGAAALGFTCTLRLQDGRLSPTAALLVAAEPARAPWLERALFPRLEYRMASGVRSQPLVLELVRQLDRSVVSVTAPVTLLFLSGIGLAVALRFLHQRERSEQARAAAYRALDEERAGLELRVRERTRELSRTNEELERENRARWEAEGALRRKSLQLRRLSHRLIEAQEQERRGLARELHDDMGQTLTAIRTHAQLVRQQNPDPAHPSAHSAEAILDLAGHLYDSTHRIMRRLRPRALDDLGLADALQTSIDTANLAAQGVEVHTDLSGKLEGLDDAVSITAYRLLQEALTNVARHAGARNVWIRLAAERGDTDAPSAAGDRLTLSVEDDGRGLAESGLDQDRLGLLGAQERVEALGGRFSVESGARGGVLLRAEIPLARG